MSRYRKVDPRIWNDANFSSLSDQGKLAFLFVMTHPHMTAVGAMRATMSGMAEELGWNQKAFAKAFKEGLAKGMYKHDPKACFVSLPNFIKYNRPENPNVLRGWSKAWDLVPECALKNELHQTLKVFAEGLGEAFSKAFAEAFGQPLPKQEQEQEQDKDSGGAADRCPHQKIVDLYHDILPSHPRVLILNDDRRSSIRARWNSELPSLDDWSEYFSVVAASSFLTGRVDPGPNRAKPFIADFEFLIRPSTVVKVMEGKYDD